MSGTSRTHRRPSNIVVDVALALLAVLAVASCAYALYGVGGRAESNGREVVALPTESRQAVTSLWFGDSIIEGCCRTIRNSPSIAEVATSRLGWAEPQIVGAGGTGYTTGRTMNGVRVGPYTERIEDAVDGAYYDVVVVAGGNNDAGPAFDPVAFRTAVRNVLGQARRSLPEAHLVVLGPYSPDGTGFVAQRAIQSEEAARIGATFIDQVARGWMRDRPELLHSDGFHPNDAGQSALGVQAAAALRELLPPDPTAPRPADVASQRVGPRTSGYSSPRVPSRGPLPRGVPRRRRPMAVSAVTGLRRKRSTWS